MTETIPSRSMGPFRCYREELSEKTQTAPPTPNTLGTTVIVPWGLQNEHFEHTVLSGRTGKHRAHRPLVIPSKMQGQVQVTSFVPAVRKAVYKPCVRHKQRGRALEDPSSMTSTEEARS